MDSALVWLRARFTPRRRSLAVLVASAPVLAVVALLVGVATGTERVAALVALALLVAAIAAIGLVVAVARRRIRRVRSVLDGASVDGTRPVAGVRPTARARRIAAVRAAAGIPLPMVAGFAMATRSPFGRDLLAEAATGGRLSADDIAAIVRTEPDAEVGATALGATDPLALLLLARTSASLGDDELADSLARHVAATTEARSLPITARQLLAERLVVAGELARAAQVLGTSASSTAGRLVALDTVNPFVPGSRQPDEALWTAALNAMYRSAGIEGIVLAPTGASAFDRLGAEAVPGVGGPLVSVIMTAFRPDPVELETAVAAVRAQSWVDWELLLVDDGSPRASARVLERVAATDDRIRMMRFDDNRGTYLRRNAALDAARGVYVTFQDADDWMHPRRLELQVAHLERHPALLADLVRSARVTPDLRFVQGRGTHLRLAESSLLVRRADSLARVGYFDGVRKAADTSFRMRLEAAVGAPVPVLPVAAPLILSRYSHSSLSGADLRDGWTHPARVAYSSAHATWLADQVARGRSLRLDAEPAIRPFPAPASLLGQPPPSRELDVLVVLDVRDDRRRRRAAARVDAAIAQLAAAGLAVGVRRSDALTSTWVAPAARRPLQRLINDGTLVEVLPDEPTRATLVIVPDERCLLGVGEGRPVEASRLLVVVSRARSGTEGVAWHRVETLAGARRLVVGAGPEVVGPAEAQSALAGLSARANAAGSTAV